MLAVLALTAALAPNPPLAINDVPPGSFGCNDPAFTIERDGRHGTLKATLQTTTANAQYTFMQIEPVNGETVGVITVGEPIGFGRSVPSISNLTVSEKINLPDGVNVFRIRVDNLRPQPVNVICAQTPVPPA
jgi:hypothetical protein